MRVEVTKWLFAGSQVQKASFFEKAQEAGIIEFTASSAKVHRDPTHEQMLLIEALKRLQHQPPVPSLGLFEDPLEVARECLELFDQLETAAQREKELQKELERVSVLGNFSLVSLEHLATISHLRPQFVSTTLDLLPPCYLFELNQQEGVRYLLWLAGEHESLPAGFHLMSVERDPELIREGIEQQQSLQIQAEIALGRCKSQEPTVRKKLIDLLDLSARMHATGLAQPHLDQSIFAVEGWVASCHHESLEKLLQSFMVIATPIPMRPCEVAPTYLENQKIGQLGQDLIAIYDVPSSDDEDPSLWVLGFFALFFGMIIGDGGYGLIFLTGTLYSYYKWPQSKGFTLRMQRLALVLSCSCILWGVLSASFFGINFEPSHPIRKVSLVHTLAKAKARYHWALQDATYKEAVQKMPQLAGLSSKQPQKILDMGYMQTAKGPSHKLAGELSDQVLLEFSLLLGAVHIILSLARYLRRNWSSLGWILFLIGGWLYFPKEVNATTFVNYLLNIDPSICSYYGLWLIYIGFSLSMILAVIRHKWLGLQEAMNVIQVFADVMSYLRLYALGLAGAIMAATFNEMAENSGVFLGFFILLIGHSVNLVLAIMSGVIHGLRLNFLEWYHYSFNGGGNWHRPLKKFDLNESSLP